MRSILAALILFLKEALQDSEILPFEIPFADYGNFGDVVAIWEDYLVVGGLLDVPRSGAIWIFDRDDDNLGLDWQPKKQFSPNQQDDFGISVSIHDNTIAVGAPAYQSYSGAVYIYSRSTATDIWSYSTTITADEMTNGENFGSSVFLFEDLLIVGASGHNQRTGVVYIFQKDLQQSEWSFRNKFSASDQLAESLFGDSIGVSSEYIVVGAPSHGAQNVQLTQHAPGAAYIFPRDPSVGSVAKLTSPDSSIGRFGECVAISDDIVAVTSPLVQNGIVYLFRKERSANSWQLLTKLSSPNGGDGDQFGASLAMREGVIAIGAPFADIDCEDCGAAYLYVYSVESDTFQLKMEYIAEEQGSDYLFGTSVALDQRTIVVGCPANGLGKVYTFSRTEFGSFDIDTEISGQSDIYAETTQYTQEEETTELEQKIWGSFDGTRVFPAATLTGPSHVKLRELITSLGGVIATPTSALDSAYLSQLDVFYTSALNPAYDLTPDEMDAFEDWLTLSGGVVIATLTNKPTEIGPYHSFLSRSFMAESIWAMPSNSTNVYVNSEVTHLLTKDVNVVTFESGVTFSVNPSAKILFEFQTRAAVALLENIGNSAGLEPEPEDGGVSVGGTVLTIGDHSCFTDKLFQRTDNSQLAENVVKWINIAVRELIYHEEESQSSQSENLQPPQTEETQPPQTEETQPPQTQETQPPQTEETQPPQTQGRQPFRTAKPQYSQTEETSSHVEETPSHVEEASSHGEEASSHDEEVSSHVEESQPTLIPEPIDVPAPSTYHVLDPEECADERFEAIESKIDVMDAKIDRIEDKIDALLEVWDS